MNALQTSLIASCQDALIIISSSLVMKSILNVPDDARNSIDRMYIHGCYLANEYRDRELRRICCDNVVKFMGRMKVSKTSFTSKEWTIDLEHMSTTYNLENYVLVYISKISYMEGHANLLIGCPSTGLYMLYDPHGHRASDDVYEQSVSKHASSLHAKLQEHFSTTIPFQFEGLRTACPRTGPQAAFYAKGKEVGVDNKNLGMGTCLAWSLVLLTQLFGKRPLLTPAHLAGLHANTTEVGESTRRRHIAVELLAITRTSLWFAYR